MTEVILPFLHEMGERWEQGETSVAEEHFASAIIRGRLASFTLTWGVGSGPIVVMACPSGERHDIGLLCFGVLLGVRGWRIRYLGADTPSAALASACEVIAADLVVVAATRENVFAEQATALAAIAQDYPMAIGGAGATADLAQALGAHLLPPALVPAAELCRTLLAPRP